MFESKEQFKKVMSAFTEMLLTQEQGIEPENEYRGFVHIATRLMIESFESGISGSSIPGVIEKLRTADNPLATAIASAMEWSYRQGIEARG